MVVCLVTQTLYNFNAFMTIGLVNGRDKHCAAVTVPNTSYIKKSLPVLKVATFVKLQIVIDTQVYRLFE